MSVIYSAPGNLAVSDDLIERTRRTVAQNPVSNFGALPVLEKWIRK
jgi:hypothetical protein